MNEFTVLVPQTFNDGSAIPADTLRELRDYAVRLFGGVTLGETVSGIWENDGTTYHDILQRYIIASDNPADVDMFAQCVCAACEQISVYVSQTSTNVRFVSRSQPVDNRQIVQLGNGQWSIIDSSAADVAPSGLFDTAGAADAALRNSR